MYANYHDMKTVQLHVLYLHIFLLKKKKRFFFLLGCGWYAHKSDGGWTQTSQRITEEGHIGVTVVF